MTANPTPKGSDEAVDMAVLATCRGWASARVDQPLLTERAVVAGMMVLRACAIADALASANAELTERLRRVENYNRRKDAALRVARGYLLRGDYMPPAVRNRDLLTIDTALAQHPDTPEG